MAKKQKEKAVVEEIKDTTQEQKVEETKVEEKVDLSKFESKDDPSVVKIDLSKPPKTEETNADTEQETTDVVEDKQTGPLQEVVEEVPQ